MRKGQPRTLSRLLALRLQDLSEYTRKSLRAASVIGTNFNIQLTAEVLGVTASDLLSTLHDAIVTDVISEEETSSQHLRFTQPLMRDVLYADLSPQERRELHLQAAIAHTAHQDNHASCDHISDHLHRALPLASIETAIQYASKAASVAASRYDFAGAEFYYERALGYLGDEAPDKSARCSLLLQLSRAQLYNGRPNAARETILTAAATARDLESPVALADCALALSPDLLSIGVGTCDLTLIRLLEEAIELIPNTDRKRRAHLLSRLSQAQSWLGRPEECELSATEALENTSDSDVDKARIAALSARTESLQGPASAPSRIKILNEIGRLTWRHEDIPARISQQTRLVSALLECGMIAEAEAENECCADLAQSTGLPQLRWYPESVRTTFRMLRGNLEPDAGVEQLYQECQNSVPADPNILQGYACQTIYRQLECDSSDAIVPTLTQVVHANPRVRSWKAALASILSDRGRLDDALRLLRSFTPRDIECLAREAGGGIGLAGLAEVAVTTADSEYVSLLYSHMLPLIDRAAVAGYGVVYFGALSRYVALLEYSLGAYDDALEHIDLALNQEESRGAVLWRGYAAVDKAKMLASNGARNSDIDQLLAAAHDATMAYRAPRLRRMLHQVRAPLQ